MIYNAFGHDNARVSRIGLGTWQLGAEWGKVDDQTAQRVLEAAVESGVNFFDTADVYGRGLSERRIAQFLKGRKDRIFIATKLGRFPDPGWPANFTAETIRKHTEASLQRLGVEALDLTQLHCVPMEQMRAGGMFDALRDLKTEGKILRFGASVESMEEALVCLEQPGLASLQIIFNIFRQKPIDVLFERAKAKGVALIIRLPLASGLLAGKFNAKSTFPPDDHRNFNRNGESFNVGETFAGLPFEKGLRLVDELKPILGDSATPAQLAMRWILDHDAATVVIPGAKNAEQARQNAMAADLPALSRQTHEALRAFYRECVAPHIRGPY